MTIRKRDDFPGKHFPENFSQAQGAHFEDDESQPETSRPLACTSGFLVVSSIAF